MRNGVARARRVGRLGSALESIVVFYEKSKPQEPQTVFGTLNNNSIAAVGFGREGILPCEKAESHFLQRVAHF